MTFGLTSAEGSEEVFSSGLGTDLANSSSLNILEKKALDLALEMCLEVWFKTSAGW